VLARFEALGVSESRVRSILNEAGLIQWTGPKCSGPLDLPPNAPSPGKLVGREFSSRPC
jgi:hypothetical protein